MKKNETAPQSVEQTTEVYQNYLKENKVVFETEKIIDLFNKLQLNSKENLRECVHLGSLFEGVKARFLSAEAKQQRKNLGLKISVKHFIETNFNPISESYFNRHIKAFANSKLMFNDKLTMLEEYLNTGHVGKAINIDNFNTWCNPKKESIVEAVESVESVESVEAVESVESVESVDFGGVKLSLNKASKEDIEKAIEYLQNKVK